jgi:glucose/arabinose dehydrogenase
VISASGDLLVFDRSTDTVLRFGPDGAFLETVIAPAHQWETLQFRDLAFGPDGHLYALSASQWQIRRYDGASYAPLAHFPIHAPLASAGAMAFSPAGDLFVTTSGAGNGAILRYSGSDGSYLGVFVSGVGLGQPADLAFGPDGHLYVSTHSDGRIFRYDGATGALLGSFGPHALPTHPEYGPYLNTGSLVFTDLPGPIPGVTRRIDAEGDGVHPIDAAIGLSVAPDGTAVVASMETDDVFRVAPDGTRTRILTAAGDGAGALLDRPVATAVAPDGSVFVAGSYSHSVFRVDPQGVVTRILAGGIWLPLDVAVDLAGNVYVPSHGTDSVVRVAPDGSRSDIIGPAGDGTGNVLDQPVAVAVDRAGVVYVAGERSNNVFRITPAGAITEIVDASGDGAGHPLDYPRDLAVDSAGNVYVSAGLSDNVLRIAPDGTIEQVAWFAGSPEHLVLDKLDHLFVALSGTDEVVMVTAAGEKVPVVRRGGAGAGGQLITPSGLGVDDAGRVYVSGFETNNVLRADVSPECSNGLDDDGDGHADFPADPGCLDGTSVEDPACDDDVDNDGDGKVDWDGGAGAATPDPQCKQAWRDRETAGGCGVGAELVLVLAPLALRARQRGRSRRDRVESRFSPARLA